MLLQQSTQVALDDMRYQQRLKDASRYSRSLLQTFPVEVIKAPQRATAASATESIAQVSSTSAALYVSYDKFRRRLYELNRNEYDFAPCFKRQKVARCSVNYLDEQSRGNQRLLQRLQRALSGYNARCDRPKPSSGRRNVLSTKKDDPRKVPEPNVQAETTEVGHTVASYIVYK